MVKTTFGAAREAGAGGAGPRSTRCRCQPELLVKVATDPEVTQSSVVADRAEARRASRRTASATTAATWSQQLVVSRCSTIGSTSCRASRTRSSSAPAPRQRPDADGRDVSLGAGVQDGKIEAGPRRAGDRSEARRASTGSAPRSSIARRSGCSPATTAPTPSATRPRAARYAQEYVNHFLEGEPSPGIAYEHQLVQQLMPAITVGRRQRRGQGAVRRRQPGHPRRVAAEGERRRADRRPAAGRAGRDRRRGGDAWNDTAIDARR